MLNSDTVGRKVPPITTKMMLRGHTHYLINKNVNLATISFAMQSKTKTAGQLLCLPSHACYTPETYMQYHFNLGLKNLLNEL